MPDSSPIRRLDLGPNGVHTFSQASDVHDFFHREVDAWQFLTSVPFVAQRIIPTRSNLKQARTDGKIAFSDEGKWKEFTTRAAKVYSSHIHSESPRGRFVLALKSLGASVAAGAYWAMVAPPPYEEADVDVARGLMYGQLYQAGAIVELSESLKTIESLRADIMSWWGTAKAEVVSDQAAISEAKREIAELKVRLLNEMRDRAAADEVRGRDLQASYDDRARTSYEEFQNKLHMAETEWNRLVSGHEEQMNALRRTFQEELSLRSPVRYWLSKKKAHKCRAVVYGVAFAGSLCVALASLVWLVLTSDKYHFLPIEIDWARPPIGRMVIVALIITGAAWIVRTFARLFFSNLHLHADADERAVMVTTYLALMKKEAAIKDDDRRLVLETLFRRSSTGIFRDDANPPHLLNVIKSAE